MFSIPTTLPDDPVALQQMLRAAMAEIERQRLIIAALQRNRFGRRSERLDEAIVQRGVEDLEQAVAEQSAALHAVASRSNPPLPNPA
ncbi:MAG: transposase domain-containing protein, partial [Streptosporangiaceae bacterium]